MGRHDTQWYLLGDVLYFGVSWLLFVTITRVTGTATAGVYSLGLAVATPIVQVLKLQLRLVVATEAQRQFEERVYFTTRIHAGLLSIVVCALVAMIVGDSLGAVLIMVLVAGMKVSETVNDLTYGILQRRKEFKSLSISKILRAGCILVVSCGLLLITESIALALFAAIACNIGVFALRDARQSSLNVPDVIAVSGTKSGRRSVLSVVQANYTLGLTMGVIALQEHLPRLLVEYYIGEEMLGIFVALIYGIYPGRLTVKALSNAMAPDMARKYAEGVFRAKWFIRPVVLSFVITVVSCGLAYAFGDDILGLIYGSDLREFRLELTAVLAAGFFVYLGVASGYILTSLGYYRSQIPVYAVVTATVGMVGILSIPAWGLFGAAVAVAAGGLAEVIGAWVVVQYGDCITL